MPSYYAVLRGHVPGIYNTWAECKTQTEGFSGNSCKKFNTHGEAAQWLANESMKGHPTDVVPGTA